MMGISFYVLIIKQNDIKILIQQFFNYHFYNVQTDT